MTKDIIDEAVRRFIDEVKIEYGDMVKSVILFGSCARGDYEDDSDIDLLVLLDSSSDDIMSLRNRILPVISRLDDEFDYEILFSPIVQSKSVFENNVKVIPFYQNIEREGIKYA